MNPRSSRFLWVLLVLCTPAAGCGATAIGSSEGLCAAGHYACAGDVLQLCSSDGKGFESVRTCAPGKCIQGTSDCGSDSDGGDAATGEGGPSGSGGLDGGVDATDEEADTPPALASCKQILDYYQGKGKVPASGIYKISPPGGIPAFDVYCDMTEDDGGWTLYACVTPATTQTSGTITLVSDAYMDPARFGALYGESETFRARGQTSRSTFFLSKAESTSSNCNDMSIATPEPPGCDGYRYGIEIGHREAAACCLTELDYAYLMVRAPMYAGEYGPMLQVGDNSPIVLWHRDSPTGPYPGTHLSAEYRVEFYIK